MFISAVKCWKPRILSCHWWKYVNTKPGSGWLTWIWLDLTQDPTRSRPVPDPESRSGRIQTQIRSTKSTGYPARSGSGSGAPQALSTLWCLKSVTINYRYQFSLAGAVLNMLAYKNCENPWQRPIWLTGSSVNSFRMLFCAWLLINTGFCITIFFDLNTHSATAYVTTFC